MEGFTPSEVAQGVTAFGLLITAVIAFVKEVVVPGVTHRRLQESEQAWRKAAEDASTALAEERRQKALLLDSTQTTARILQALPGVGIAVGQQSLASGLYNSSGRGEAS